jgi:hypothetical protein
MPCTRDLNYQNDNGTIPNTISSNKCRKYKPFLPSFAPIINNLSVTSSKYKKYSIVYISGSNFLPPVYGDTYVNFGEAFTKIPITFYSCFNISFVVPLNAIISKYQVKVVNIYNGNYSPGVNTTYPGIPNYSNSITYTIY